MKGERHSGAEALLEAARCDHLEELQRQIHAGAPVNVPDDEGRPPLQLAVMFSAPALVRALIDAGASPHVTSDTGHTLLHQAAMRGHPSIVRALLAAGCPADAPDEQGLTPLMMSPGPGCEPMEGSGPDDAGHVDPHGVAAALIEAGAAVDARDASGRTALHHALAGGHWEVAEALLSAGASPNATAADGSTPLHAVADWIQWPHTVASAGWAVITLVRRGADPAARDAAGQTAAERADGGGTDSDFERLVRKVSEPPQPPPGPDVPTAQDIDDAFDSWHS